MFSYLLIFGTPRQSTFISGKTPENDVHLSALNIKPGFKIMMMGSLEEEIEAVSLPPEDLPDVVNDFDIPEEEEVDVCNREVN